MKPAFRTAVVVGRLCLARAALPWLGTTAVAAAAATTIAADGEAAAAALEPWLHLPAFVAAAACCWTAIECWPAFARQRPGADWLLRLRPGPWSGCGAAACGALAALAALLAPLGLLAAVRAPAPRVHRPLAPLGAPVLDAQNERVTFAAGGGTFAELQLRPAAFLPAAEPAPTTLQVFADGRPLLAEPMAIRSTHQLLRVALPPQPIRELALGRARGNLPLLFAEGSAVLVGDRDRSRLANSMLALWCYLLPAAVALALATLAAAAVALPVNLLLATTALLLQTLGNLGPAPAALAALLHGRWLPAEPLFQSAIPSLGTGLLAMILAMPVRRRLRR